jgi:serine phosphatase RsbU (regulator of sigma subunit)/HAMP domain-containing protein
MKRRLRASSIRSKLTLYLLAVFLVLSVLHWRTYHVAYRSRQRLALAATQQDNRDAARLTALAMESLTLGAARVQMAALQFLADHGGRRSSANTYLTAICRSDRNCLSWSYLSPSGKVLSGSDPQSIGDDLSAREDVRLAARGRTPVVSDVYRTASGVSCFAVDSIVIRGGRVRGIMRTEISAYALSRLLPAKRVEGTLVAVLDHRGAEIYQSGSLRFGVSASDLRRMLFVEKAIQSRSLVASDFKASDGSLRAACAVPVRGGDWVVVAARPVQDGLAGVGGYFTKGFAASLLYTAILLVLFWWECGIWLTGNLRRLARGAAAIAVGDLGKRIIVDTGDELETLANAFNSMAESLQVRDRQIQGKSAALEGLLDVSQVVTSSLDLDTVVEAISQAANRRFGAKSAAVYLYDDQRNVLEQLAYHRFGLDGSESPPADWETTALRSHKRAQLQMVELPAVEADDIEGSSDSEVGDVVAAIPLVASDRAAGVLIVLLSGSELRDEDYRSDMLDLLRAFGSHAAVALQNAKAYARAEDYSKSLAAWLDELSALRYVTEAITASLDLNEVLRTLTRLTCDVMRARSCGITMMDAGGALAVQEAHGLSPAMWKDCACRIGEPVAGLAAAEKRPVTSTDLVSEYPRLRMAVRAAREGLHGFLSVPLIFGKEVLGTIDVWMSDPYEFTAYQIDLLSSIAAHAAMVIQNARLFGKEYRIAETLQSVILGSIPDEINGVELGCKYAPALDEAHVGGDFYDAFTLPGGKVAIVVADVSGKGLAAAVHTAMCKYMLRGFAYHWPDSPAHALELLNEAISGFAASRFYVTMFYCVIDPLSGKMTYANAGHPPAVWISDSGLRQVLLYQTGMPIGMDSDVRFHEKTVTLRTEDRLILYTDGIMDARQGAETLGIEGLQEILFAAADEHDPKALVEMLYTETLRYADDAVRDDIAIMAVRAYEVGSASSARRPNRKGEAIADLPQLP